MSPYHLRVVGPSNNDQMRGRKKAHIRPSPYDKSMRRHLAHGGRADHNVQPTSLREVDSGDDLSLVIAMHIIPFWHVYVRMGSVAAQRPP